MKISTILVPVRGLPVDADALELACTLAAPSGDRRPKQRVKVEAIYVVEVPQALPLDVELPDAVRAGDAVLAWAETTGRHRDIEVGAELLQARSAGVAIVDEAIERHADLIIMGAQYRRRHGEYNLGITLPYVLKNAPCRVWVARAPRGEGAPGERGTAG